MQRVTEGFEFEEPLGLETYRIEPSAVKFKDKNVKIGRITYTLRDRRKLSLMLHGKDCDFKYLNETIPIRNAPFLITVHNNKVITRVSSVNYRPFDHESLRAVLDQSANETVYTINYVVGGLPYINATYKMGKEVKIHNERFSPMVLFSNHNTGGTSLKYGAGLVVSACANGMITWYTGAGTPQLNVRTVHIAENITKAAEKILSATFDTIENSTLMVTKLIDSVIDYETFSKYVTENLKTSKKILSLIEPTSTQPSSFDIMQKVTKFITHGTLSRNMYNQLMKLSQELQVSALRINNYNALYLLSAP
jgi:hypothetical protein